MVSDLVWTLAKFSDRYLQQLQRPIFSRSYSSCFPEGKNLLTSQGMEAKTTAEKGELEDAAQKAAGVRHSDDEDDYSVSDYSSDDRFQVDDSAMKFALSKGQATTFQEAIRKYCEQCIQSQTVCPFAKNSAVTEAKEVKLVSSDMRTAQEAWKVEADNNLTECRKLMEYAREYCGNARDHSQEVAKQRKKVAKKLEEVAKQRD